MFNYRVCPKCNEKFYGDRSKLIDRIKSEYKIAMHMVKEHKEWTYLINTILATVALPLIPLMWVVHKMLYPFWCVYEWLDDIDCM